MIGPILSALAPCVVTAILFVLLTSPFATRVAPQNWARAAGAIAAGLGAATGIFIVLGPPALPPREAVEWLGVSAVVLACFGVAELISGKRVVLRSALRVAIVAILFALTLRPIIAHTWSAPESAAWLTGLTAIAIVTWLSFEANAKDGDAPIVSALLLLTLTGASVVMLLGGSAKLAQIAGATTSAFGGAAVLVWSNPRRYVAAGAVAVVWPLSALVWTQGYFYAEAPASSMLLIITSCFTPWLMCARWLKARATWQRSGVATLATIALLAAALLVAYSAYNASASEYGY